MRRRVFSPIKAALLLMGVGVVAIIIFPIFGRARYTGHGSCQSNLKQIGLGFKMYVVDWDERFPFVSSEHKGWVDTIHPYLKSYSVFHCPSVVERDNDQSTDYFYNARLSGIEEETLSFITSTIMNGDGLAKAGANTHITELPFDWLRDTSSPAFRHIEGANYSFADGHVKWLKPNRVSNQSPESDNSTFVTE